MKQFIFPLLALLLLLPLPAFGLNVGEKAPLFEAPSTHGTISIADYVGKKVVILAFYFKDFTSG
jgi:peroxiredoxin Q/BCP